ncbi:MAG: peptidylprolyl isomerase [Clostridia bacterium]|nr:peptidylprolyl isomerase [Clostridia bacterium]
MEKNPKANKAKRRHQAHEEKLRRDAEKRKRENRLIWIFTAILGAILLIIAVSVFLSSSDKDTASKPAPDPLEGFTVSETATNYVRMLVTYTDKTGKPQSGNIVVELRPDKAPITVRNFKKLVSEGFYDGLTFHRIDSGFMIQGGDPNGDGSGGSPDKIKGEFSSNGVVNDLSHTRGVISMARTSPDSASSQFFIMHQDTPSLDGKYAAFGKVIFGMDTVDGIAGTQTIRAPGSQDKDPTKPVHPVTIQRMVFVTPGK